MTAIWNWKPGKLNNQTINEIFLQNVGTFNNFSFFLSSQSTMVDTTDVDTNGSSEQLPMGKRLVLSQYDSGSSTKHLRNPKTVDGVVFLPFYHFPFIVGVRAFVKLKLYQTIFTFLLVPGIITLKAVGVPLSENAIQSRKDYAINESNTRNNY